MIAMAATRERLRGHVIDAVRVVALGADELAALLEHQDRLGTRAEEFVRGALRMAEPAGACDRSG